jgi:hypothetical protein
MTTRGLIRWAVYGQEMGGRTRRDRLPARRDRGPGGALGGGPRVISGADVVLVGLFSAKSKDHAKTMDDAARRVESLGGRVVARLVQRRGVSQGGAAAMSWPLSRRTLVSEGKAHEITVACDARNAAAVVFVNLLTPHQERTLTGLCGRPVVSLSEADMPASLAPGTLPRQQAEPHDAH